MAHTLLQNFGQVDLGTCPKCGTHNSYLPYIDRSTGQMDLAGKIGLCLSPSCGHSYSHKNYMEDRAKLKGVKDYRLLNEYTLNDLKTCPCCSRPASYLPYENIETLDLLPDYVGKCLHTTCNYEYDIIKYLKDNQ